MADMNTILVGVVTTLIATAITAAFKKVAYFLDQNRKKNELARDERLKSLRKSFSAFSCARVAKSQDRNYVIAEIRKLIDLSEEYFNESHPGLRKEMTFPFLQLCREADDYWNEVSWEQPHCKPWMNLPIIRIFFRDKGYVEHTIEEIKTCYKDLHTNLRHLLIIESRIWRGLIAADDIDPNNVITEYRYSRWYFALHPCVLNEEID